MITMTLIIGTNSKNPGWVKFLAAVKSKLEQVALRPEDYGAKTKKGYREARLNIFPFIIVFKIYHRKKIIFVNALHHERKKPVRKFRK